MRLVVILLLTLPGVPTDRVHHVDGKVLEGTVVDEGPQIRLIKDLGSITIPKRDIIKIDIEEEEVIVDSDLDRVILKSGEEIVGKVHLQQEGDLVVVTGKFGEIRHPQAEVREIIFGQAGGARPVRRSDRIRALILKLAEPEQAEVARREIFRHGVFAITPLEEALPESEGMQKEGIEYVLRANRLRTVLTLPIEDDIPDVYDRLLGEDPKIRLETLQKISLYHGEDLAPVVLHMLEEGEKDPEIRGYVINELGRTGKTRELMEFLETGDFQVQLASAIALGEAGIYVGIPVLIQALAVPDETVRRTAFEKLREFTGKEFLYFPDGPEEDRQKAILRWKEWWEEERDDYLHRSLKEYKKGVVTEEEREEAEKFFLEGSASLDRIAGTGGEEEKDEILRGIILLRRAVDTDPTMGKARLHLAILHYMRGKRSDLTEAERELRAVVERHAVESGKDVVKLAYYYLGRIAEDRLEWEQARLQYEDATRADPDFVDGYLSLARVVHQRAILEEGIEKETRQTLLENATRRYQEALDATLRHYDGLKEASKDLSLIQGRKPYRGGAFRSHLRDYNAILKVKSAEIHYGKGRALAALQDFEGALKEYDLAVRNDPEHPVYKEAAEFWRDFLDRQPSAK